MKYKYSAKSPEDLFQIKNLRAIRGQRLDSTKSCTPEMNSNSFPELENFNFEKNYENHKINDVMIKNDKGIQLMNINKS